MYVCSSGDTVVNKGCGGGNPMLAYQYIAKNGLVPWTAYPYEEKVMMVMRMMMVMVMVMRMMMVVVVVMMMMVVIVMMMSMLRMRMM